MAVKEKLNISGARIVWPNFSGKATDYNTEGKRNFTVVFDDDQAVASFVYCSDFRHMCNRVVFQVFIDTFIIDTKQLFDIPRTGFPMFYQNNIVSARYGFQILIHGKSKGVLIRKSLIGIMK